MMGDQEMLATEIRTLVAALEKVCQDRGASLFVSTEMENSAGKIITTIHSCLPAAEGIKVVDNAT
jgi:hypothetical protein